MHKWVLRICLAAIATVLTYQTAHADNYLNNYGNVGNWRVLSDADGGAHCVADTDNAQVTLRIIYYAEVGEWGLAMPYYGQHTTSNGYAVQVPAEIGFDGGWRGSVEFSASDDGWATYAVPHGSLAYNNLRSKSSIELNMDRGIQSFSLAKSTAAMNMAEECGNNNGSKPVANAANAAPKNGFSVIVNLANSFEDEYASVRGWQVLSGHSNNGFEYCVAQKSDAGSFLRLGVDRYFSQWQLGVPYPATPLWEGALEIDGNSGRTLGTSDGSWSIVWLNHAYDLDRIRNGSQLILDIGRASLDYSLSGSAAAMLKIEECVANQGAKSKFGNSTVNTPQKSYPVESDAHRMGPGCPKLGAVYSHGSNQLATVEFFDETSPDSGAKQVYWFDRHGNPSSVGIFENGVLNLDARVGDTFIVKDFSSRCYGGIFELDAGHNVFYVR